MNDQMKRKLKKLVREPKQFFIDSKIFGPIFCYFCRPILSYSSQQPSPLSLELPQRLFDITPAEDIVTIMKEEHIEAIIFFWKAPVLLKKDLRRMFKNYLIIYVEETPDTESSIKKFLIDYQLPLNKILFSYLYDGKDKHTISIIQNLASTIGVNIKYFDPIQLQEKINSQILHFEEPSREKFMSICQQIKDSSSIDTQEVAKLVHLLRDLHIGPWKDTACHSLKSFSKYSESPYILVLGDEDLSTEDSKRLELEVLRTVQKESGDLNIFYVPHPTQVQYLNTKRIFIDELKKYSTPILTVTSMVDALMNAQRVYTRKSFGAFFAILYNVPVTLFEKTFYAELGFTDDRWQNNQCIQRLSFEELFYVFFFECQHYEPVLKDKASNFIIYALNIAASYKEKSAQLFFRRFSKYKYTISKTDFWPLFLSKKILPKIIADKTNKLEKIFPVRILFENTNDSDSQLILSFLFAGIMRRHPSWKRYLTLLSELLPNSRQIEIFSLWNMMIPTDEAVRNRLLSAHEKTRDFSSIRNILRNFLNNENNNTNSEYRLFSKHQYKAAIQLVTYEIRDGRLNKAFNTLLSLLFSGFTTEEVIYTLALIEQHRFHFSTAKILINILAIAFPQWGKDRAALHLDINIMTNDIAYALSTLTIKAAQGAEIPSLVFLQKKITTTYGEYDWQGILATLVPETSLMAKVRSCLHADQFSQAFNYLCKITPAIHEVKNYFNTFIQYFTLSKNFEEADKFLESMFGKVPDNLFYSKAIEIEYTRRNYQKAKQLYKKCIDLKIEILPNTKYIMQYMLGDLHEALETNAHSWKPRKIYLNALGSQALETLENIDPNSVQSLLVLADGGPGDEIRAAAFYPQIAKKAGVHRTVFTCDKRLYTLFKRSFPELEFHPFQRLRHHSYITDMSLYSQVPSPDFVWIMDNTVWEAVKSFDKVIRYYSARVDIVGSHTDIAGTPYLKADPILSSNLRSRLKKENKLLVGICWRSSLQSSRRRSAFLSIEELIPILELDCIQLVNCQSDGYTKEEKLFLEQYPNKIIEIPEIDQFNDLDAAAALYSSLDLMVSCPTSIINITGALGIPTITFSFTHEIDILLKPNCNCNLYYKSVTHIGQDLPCKEHGEVVRRLREEILSMYNSHHTS